MISKSDKDVLINMGFPPSKVEEAIRATNGTGLQPTMNWLLVHPDDNDDKGRRESKGVNNSNISSRSNIESGKEQKSPPKNLEFLIATAQRKKQMREEKLARARIRAQIEADRRENAANRELEKLIHLKQENNNDNKVESTERVLHNVDTTTTTTTTANDYSETKLQLITPNGERIIHTFKSSDILELVYEFIGEQISDPFHLMTTFPRRKLDDEERYKSLKELNLVPSGTLIVDTS